MNKSFILTDNTKTAIRLLLREYICLKRENNRYLFKNDPPLKDKLPHITFTDHYHL